MKVTKLCRELVSTEPLLTHCFDIDWPTVLVTPVITLLFMYFDNYEIYCLVIYKYRLVKHF